ncbi:MAG: hypothetical protein HQK60_12500 [Deltaproteobacteria bacterium]|nr:hypothetical protein [Deltaproteobacteria bacterium]
METLTLRIHGEGIKAVREFLKTLPPQFVEIIRDEEVKWDMRSPAEAATNLRTLLYKGIDQGNLVPEQEADRIAVEATAFARQKK